MAIIDPINAHNVPGNRFTLLTPNNIGGQTETF